MNPGEKKLGRGSKVFQRLNNERSIQIEDSLQKLDHLNDITPNKEESKDEKKMVLNFLKKDSSLLAVNPFQNLKNRFNNVKKSVVNSINKLTSKTDDHGLNNLDQLMIEKLLNEETSEEDAKRLSEDLFFVDSKSSYGKDLSKYIEVKLQTEKNKNSQIIFKEKLKKLSSHYSSVTIKNDAGTPTSFFVFPIFFFS